MENFIFFFRNFGQKSYFYRGEKNNPPYFFCRENAPCIVFIDEIDAVGGKRKTGGSTSDYSRMTINQLLQEMDGFKSNDDVIVIGATNLKGTQNFHFIIFVF